MQYHIKDFLKETYLNIRKILLFPFLSLRKVNDRIEGEIKKILFLRHDRVGDMVLSTTALKALRKTYPDAKITVLASDRNHEIIQNNPYVDEILIYKGIGWFIKEIRSRGFDLAIDASIDSPTKWFPWDNLHIALIHRCRNFFSNIPQYKECKALYWKELLSIKDVIEAIDAIKKVQ